MERIYNEDPSRYNSSVVALAPPVADHSGPLLGNIYILLNSFALYYFQNQVTREKETIYQSGLNNIVVTNNYVYDVNGNIKEKSVQNSTGKILTTHYKYPNDYPPSVPGSLSPILFISREMVNKNIIAYPIETVSSILENNSERVIGAQLQTFRSDPVTDIISPLTNSTLEVPNPVNDFAPSSVGVRTVDDNGIVYHTEYLQSDSRYAGEIYYDNYDAKGNLLQYHSQSGEIHSYLWGYNKTYPIAEVKNARNDATITSTPILETGTLDLDNTYSNYITFTTLTGGDIVVTAYANPSFFLKASYSLRGPVNFSGSLCVARNSTTTCYYPINTTLSIPPGTYTLSVSRDDGEGHILYWYPTFRQETTVTKNFFHTSFEETDGNSTSGDAITGKYSRTGGYTTTLSDLVAGNYILSYWKKQGAGWEYNESTVSVPGTSYDINLTGQVDEVRFYPVDAQMITYTYEPLVGMTSKCDENNRITYYQYDGFGRLWIVRDENNKVLKKICYNYAGQPEECEVHLYGNEAISQNFTRNNCMAGQVGSSAIYTVPAATYYSDVDVATANAMAQHDIDVNGQNYANQNGSCVVPTIYARIELDNIYNDIDYSTADVYIRFYIDNSCTVAYSVAGLPVNYISEKHLCQGSSTTSNYTTTATGYEVFLGKKIIDRDDGLHCDWTTYTVTNGTGYTAK